VTILQRMPIKAEIEGSGRLSPGTMGYLCALTREAYFDYVHQKLAEAEAKGATRASIAARMGKSPSRLSKILGAPGNWTLDTITELLAAIAKERVVAESTPILVDMQTNSSPDALLADCLGGPTLYKIDITTPLSNAPPKAIYAQA
jgi:hypothetical protein